MGGGGGGKAGDFVKFLLESPYFSLLEGDIDQSQKKENATPRESWQKKKMWT